MQVVRQEVLKSAEVFLNFMKICPLILNFIIQGYGSFLKSIAILNLLKFFF